MLRAKSGQNSDWNGASTSADLNTALPHRARIMKTKNRAKRSEGDLEARGIFEFCTIVVSGVIRQQPVQNRCRNPLGNKEQIHFLPENSI
jgi:hypothetical protein